MDTQPVLDLAQRCLLPIYPRPDFVLDHGQGCRVVDLAGRDYIDCVAGIAVNALGYGDPDLLQALHEQAGKLWHVSNLYHTEPQARLAEALCTSSFAERVYFANCGASANESAFKFARRFARDQAQRRGEAVDGPFAKHGIVAFRGGFHGRLFGSLAATDRPKYQQPFEPLMPGVRFAAFNDLDSARATIDSSTAAVIVEPIQGEGGVHPAAPEFLQGLRHLCDQHEALLVFDEVQCGLGRSGALWAHQLYDVTPDLLTAAKPLAGGLPLGAVLMTQRVADAIHAFDHASTFAGGALTSAVALALVHKVSQPAFLQAVRENGAYLRERLLALDSSHVLDVRGCGLLIGVELDVPATQVVEAGYGHGLLLISAGPTVLRLAPPLVITRRDIDQVIERLAAILQAL